jgi:DNA polymerase-3 subunit chi
MSRVDFYVLRDAGEPARRRFACRLAEKAYRLKTAVHITTADAATSRELDELLWTFRDGSFVPHEIVDAGQPAGQAPVTIGILPPTGRTAGLIINLAADIAEPDAGQPRIAEIVSADEDSKRLSRQRYARYRDLGHTLETHKL